MDSCADSSRVRLPVRTRSSFLGMRPCVRGPATRRCRAQLPATPPLAAQLAGARPHPRPARAGHCGEACARANSRCRTRRSSSSLPKRQRNGLSLNLLAQLGPVDQPHLAIHVLDQRGAAFNPVAVVALANTVDVPNLGMVNVAAHDGVDAALARRLGHSFLEAADVLHGGLRLVLQIHG